MIPVTWNPEYPPGAIVSGGAGLLCKNEVRTHRKFWKEEVPRPCFVGAEKQQNLPANWINDLDKNSNIA